MLFYFQKLAKTRDFGEVKSMSTDMNLLRGKLKERCMTQQELAKKIGVDSSTISRKLASDGMKFTVGEVHEIADVLQLSASECKDIFLF
nr:MAG TPA: hypothetical protein [Caudoviricetes sp.]